MHRAKTSAHMLTKSCRYLQLLILQEYAECLIYIHIHARAQGYKPRQVCSRSPTASCSLPHVFSLLEYLKCKCIKNKYVNMRKVCTHTTFQIKSLPQMCSEFHYWYREVILRTRWGKVYFHIQVWIVFWVQCILDVIHDKIIHTLVDDFLLIHCLFLPSFFCRSWINFL